MGYKPVRRASGVVGIYWSKEKKRWRVMPSKGKGEGSVYLGSYVNLWAAKDILYTWCIENNRPLPSGLEIYASGSGEDEE